MNSPLRWAVSYVMAPLSTLDNVPLNPPITGRLRRVRWESRSALLVPTETCQTALTGVTVGDRRVYQTTTTGASSPGVQDETGRTLSGPDQPFGGDGLMVQAGGTMSISASAALMTADTTILTIIFDLEG
jgi:hypothetical protein